MERAHGVQPQQIMCCCLNLQHSSCAASSRDLQVDIFISPHCEHSVQRAFSFAAALFILSLGTRTKLLLILWIITLKISNLTQPLAYSGLPFSWEHLNLGVGTPGKLWFFAFSHCGQFYNITFAIVPVQYLHVHSCRQLPSRCGSRVSWRCCQRSAVPRSPHPGDYCVFLIC